MSEVLYPVVGCGRCADIFAAYMLTGDARIFQQAQKHLENHKTQPSIYGEVNKLAERVNPG